MICVCMRLESSHSPMDIWSAFIKCERFVHLCELMRFHFPTDTNKFSEHFLFNMSMGFGRARVAACMFNV